MYSRKMHYEGNVGSTREYIRQEMLGKQMVLRNQIARLKLKEGTLSRAHLQQFEDLVRQLRVAGLKFEESDVCLVLS